MQHKPPKSNPGWKKQGKKKGEQFRWKKKKRITESGRKKGRGKKEKPKFDKPEKHRGGMTEREKNIVQTA